MVFYVFASTHFHLLLIVDTTEQMADFMEYLGSNIARELGRLYEWGTLALWREEEPLGA